MWIITRLRLKRDRRGVSNIIVVALSLVIILVIVSNIVLWSYEMNQLDWEKMKEDIAIVDVMPNRETWSYNPSEYTLGGSTSWLSGDVSNLTSDDGVYMAFRSYYSGTDTSDFVDETCDLHPPSAKGTHSNFTAQQYGPDSILDTLTEENTGGSSLYASVRSKSWSAENVSATQNHDVLLPPTIEAGDTILVFFVNDDDEVTNFPGGWTEIYDEDAGTAGPTMVVAWKEAVGDEDGTSIIVTTGSTEHSVHVAWAIQDADDPDNNPPEVSLESAGNDEYPDALSLSPSGGSKSYLWISVSGSDDGRDLVTAYPSNMDDNNEGHTSHNSNFGVVIGLATNSSLGSAFNPANFVIENGRTWEACTVAVYPAAYANYSLDLEIQWTNANYYEQNEELCIYGGTMGSENIKVDVWNGSAWQNVFTNLTSGWNNASVSSYLESSTFTIRFKGGTETGDTTEDSWDVDVTLLHVWSGEYTLEVEFTGSSNTEDWSQLNWTVNSAWTIGSVNVTLQLYNYTLGGYSVSGNGYTAYTSDNTPNTDENKSQTINVNPTHFRNATGYWKMKVKGVKATDTQFDFKGDWIEFEAVKPVTIFTFENGGSLTIHLVSLWVNNSTNHQRYDINVFVNSAETTTYLRADISLPEGQYTVKVVTERGNTAIYSGS